MATSTSTFTTAKRHSAEPELAPSPKRAKRRRRSRQSATPPDPAPAARPVRPLRKPKASSTASSSKADSSATNTPAAATPAATLEAYKQNLAGLQKFLTAVRPVEGEAEWAKLQEAVNLAVSLAALPYFGASPAAAEQANEQEQGQEAQQPQQAQAQQAQQPHQPQQPQEAQQPQQPRSPQIPQPPPQTASLYHLRRKVDESNIPTKRVKKSHKESERATALGKRERGSEEYVDPRQFKTKKKRIEFFQEGDPPIEYESYDDEPLPPRVWTAEELAWDCDSDDEEPEIQGFLSVTGKRTVRQDVSDDEREHGRPKRVRIDEPVEVKEAQTEKTEEKTEEKLEKSEDVKAADAPKSHENKKEERRDQRRAELPNERDRNDGGARRVCKERVCAERTNRMAEKYAKKAQEKPTHANTTDTPLSHEKRNSPTQNDAPGAKNMAAVRVTSSPPAKDEDRPIPGQWPAGGSKL